MHFLHKCTIIFQINISSKLEDGCLDITILDLFTYLTYNGLKPNTFYA